MLAVAININNDLGDGPRFLADCLRDPWNC